ncbi:hypothetical protein ACWDRB_31970 [Nonomuraea sp. NPDC003707]
MQVFGGVAWATVFMTLAMNTDALHYCDQSRIYGPIFNTYLRLNMVHETGLRLVHVLVNRRFRAT